MYRSSRPTLLDVGKKRPKMANVVPEHLWLGNPVVNEETDKKGRLVVSSQESKKLTIFGKEFKAKLYELNYKKDWFGYAAVSGQHVGIGKSKAKAWNALMRVLEGYVFKTYGKV